MDSDERRHDSRLPVIWNGTLVTVDDKKYTCEVRDISLAGALISCPATFASGTELILQITELGEFAGTVKWTGSGEIGLLILAGPDLELKKFAESAGADISTRPEAPSED